MRAVEDHLAVILDAASTPEPLRIALEDALGLMAAEEVQATAPVPAFNQAAIDGYAVRAVDVGGASLHSRRGPAGESAAPPAREYALPVVGEIPAGSQQDFQLQPKQAVRVHAGAPLPVLADAVIPLDWTDRGRQRMVTNRTVLSGDFVRRIGDDIAVGDVAVVSGTVLGAAQISLLAAVGRAKVLAYPRPRVAIISVGHELVGLDGERGDASAAGAAAGGGRGGQSSAGLTPPGKVFDINSYALAAAAQEAGAEVNRIGVVAGEPRRLAETIDKLTTRCEMILISGAVGGAGSAGVRDVLGRFGDLDITRVAMHPGSVQGFAQLGERRVPTMLLPSNPVSALVAFEVFGRPFIRQMLGKRNIMRRLVRARSLNHVESRPGRRGFVRARLMRDTNTHDYLVEGLSGATGAPAHLLAGLADANALIQIPERATEVRPGDIVEVLFLSQAA